MSTKQTILRILFKTKNPTEDCWFSSVPIGHTTLADTIARLCKCAGIPGYKTNHSLRATAATRLYQAGVDEQLIMEKTGHRSLEGVRSYKRTNMEQQENLSDILSATKRPAIQSSSASVSSDTACLKTKSTQLSKKITIKTQETLKHMFTLKNCNNVSIQVNLK